MEDLEAVSVRPEDEDTMGEDIEVTEAGSPGMRIPLCISSSLLVLIEIFLSRPEIFKTLARIISIIKHQPLENNKSIINIGRDNRIGMG